MNLQAKVEDLYARETREFNGEYFRAFDELKAALNEGRVRAAGLATSALGGFCSQ